MKPGIIALLPLGLALISPPVAKAQACASLDDLEWLLGDWRSEVGTTVFSEHWERSSEGSFEGVADSRSADDKQLLSHEILSLVARSGEVLYIAEVAHNPGPVTFRLSQCPDAAVIFKNPDHDFPKQIEYRRKGEDEISAHITDGEGKGFVLYFQRVVEQ